MSDTTIGARRKDNSQGQVPSSYKVHTGTLLWVLWNFFGDSYDLIIGALVLIHDFGPAHFWMYHTTADYSTDWS